MLNKRWSVPRRRKLGKEAAEKWSNWKSCDGFAADEEAQTSAQKRALRMGHTTLRLRTSAAVQLHGEPTTDA